MPRMDFRNATDLDGERLRALCEEGMAGWAPGDFVVRVRYSRGADFSGTCFYRDRRVYINLGRHLSYPYRMKTYLARAKTVGRSWSKPLYTLEMSDAYQVVIFVFLHELYHLLVRKARRNMRQKESMCDRFAARHVVDRFDAMVRDVRGRPVPRSEWDFQDVNGFVASARQRSSSRHRASGGTKGNMRTPSRVRSIPAPAQPLRGTGRPRTSLTIASKRSTTWRAANRSHMDSSCTSCITCWFARRGATCAKKNPCAIDSPHATSSIVSTRWSGTYAADPCRAASGIFRTSTALWRRPGNGRRPGTGRRAERKAICVHPAA